VNKAELIKAVADKLGDRKSAAAAVDAVLGAIMSAALAGDQISIRGFGSFEKDAESPKPRVQFKASSRSRRREVAAGTMTRIQEQQQMRTRRPSQVGTSKQRQQVMKASGSSAAPGGGGPNARKGVGGFK
jgi:nucleoid DNA-binding protein